MKRAAIYCRVSTTGQAEQGTSLQSQLAACRTHAEREGWQVVREVQEDASGTTLDRAGLDAVRDLLASGAADILVVYDPDRLTRNLGHLMLLLDELERAGRGLVFVNSPHENTPEGMMMLQMRGMFSQYERTKIVERMRRGRDQRVRMGRIIRGRTPPYGYAYDPDNYSLRPDEPTAVWVRHAFEWYATEEISLYEVARRLNERGAPTPEGAQGWRASAVGMLFGNEVYAGRWTWGRYRHTTRPPRREERPRAEWLIVDVPPLVSEEIWHRAQYRRATNNVIGLRSNSGKYLLKDIAFCGACGSRLTSRGRDNSRGQPYYECFTRHRSREIGTTSEGCRVMVRADPLEDALWSEVVRQLSSPHLEVVRQEIAPHIAPTRLPATDSPQDALRALQRQRERLVDAYLTTDTLTKQEYERRAAALQKKADALQREIDERTREEARRIPPEHLTRYLSDKRARLHTMPFSERRQLLVDLGITVSVTRDAHTYTLMHATVSGLPLPATLDIPKPRRKGWKGA